MDQVFGFSIISLVITAILLVPFIDFLYKIKLQKGDHGKDIFNQSVRFFDKFSAWKIGTPFGGGLLILFVVTILSLWAYGLFSVKVTFWELFALLFTFVGFGLLGFYDDLRKIFNTHKGVFGLSSMYKLGIQWVLALIVGAVMYFQLGYSFVYVHWFGQLNMGIFYILFAAFTIVAFTNAVNISDGLDGLSTGLLIICLVSFLAMSGTNLDSFLSLFIATLLGSTVAFLYFNIYKARIWLGDVGALSLGAVLAVIGLLTGKPISVALIGGVFVIEVGSSLMQIVSRKFFNRRILPATPIHVYFIKRGWEEPKVVMRAWLLGVVFAILGLYIAFLK
ncbi:MAG TPA: phospho-N-acetylmuramoyl-pentapeptide-transferase [Patescibacteria group bacterium]|nr:phospho-N-acetylmuramoyl-pentapeptide-transferase [Patescibacteria group bacterium]